MALVFLSPIGGAGAQFCDNNGTPLAGGKLYTYDAGTTTPRLSYTTVAGNVPHTNPIILDAGGRIPSSGEVWFTTGVTSKIILTDAAGSTLATWDHLSGINDASNSANSTFVQSGAGAVIRSVQDKLRDVVNVKDFGAVGDGVADDTVSFTDALSTGKTVFIPYGTYNITGNINLREGSLVGEGYGYGGVGAKFTILNFSGCVDPLKGAIYNRQIDKKGQMPVVQDLWIQASSWDPVTGCLGYGLDIEAPIIANRVVVTGFKKSGVFFHNDASGNGPYESIFTNVRSLTNGQHGFLIGAGANVVTLIQCEGKWNGAPSFNVAPTVAGTYDGIHVDNTSDGGSYLSFHPTSLTIIGGDTSYNSRYGLNVNDASGSNIQLGYAEQNKSSDGCQHRVGPQLRNNNIDFGFVTSTQGMEVYCAATSGVLATSNNISANGYDLGGGGDAGQTIVYDKSKSTNGGTRTRYLYLGASDNGATNGGVVVCGVDGTVLFDAVGTGFFKFLDGVRVGNSAIADTTTLDWYEEGVFTPVVSGSTSAGSCTYAFQVGKFTRIGNVVNYSISLSWSAHTGTGGMQITGLPYVPFSDANATTPCAVLYNSLTAGAGKEVGAGVSHPAGKIVVYSMDQAGGAVVSLTMDASASIYVSGSYLV